MKKPETMSQEELIAEIKNLRSRKKYGLVWEDKPENVVVQCKQELPVLVEDSKRAVLKGNDDNSNFLIEGDNFHALSVLNYTHAKKIDLIYIDPPYNTGAKDWKYNNHFVDENDSYRHSKWLSMMNNRLKLAKNLLKEDGVLILTIDKHENGTSLLLLSEIFPAHDVITVVIEHNPKGLPSRNFSESHEYAHYVIPKGKAVIGRSPNDKVDTRNLRRAGRASFRSERPTMFYPIYVKDGKITKIGTTAEQDFHPVARAIKFQDGTLEVWPIDDKGKERRWNFGLENIESQVKRIEVRQKENDCQLYVTAVPARYKTVWTGGELDAGKYGTTLVKNIIGSEFPYPKSLFATLKCIETVIYKRKEATVLDFFAGSGTTGHAVMLMNKKFGSKHKFILCTNNENGIAKQITFPRIKKVIEGYGNEIGIPSNLRYFKTDFVNKNKVTDDTRRELVTRSTEMICIKEGTFEKKYDNKKYKIYARSDRTTGILYDLDSISEFKEKLVKIGAQCSIYVFSISNETFTSDFSDLTVKYKLTPIPESILEVYRKLFG